MNPSANGWIKKLLKELSSNESLMALPYKEFYVALRESGFIYGSNIFVVNNSIEKTDLSDEEICKINLFTALLYTYNHSSSRVEFIDSAIDFYTAINEYKTTIFQDILGGKKSTELLEKIIHKRIQIDDNIITKKFNYFIINALLFVDVLAYSEYLKKESITEDYIQNLERSIEAVTIEVLNSKKHKTSYDDGLIELFESSLRYQDNSQIHHTKALKNIDALYEKYYILDIACMATWSDRVIDDDEQNFLNTLSADLAFDEITVEDAIASVNHFYTTYKDNIALLSSKNIVKSFYDNSSKMVSKLISRNGKRLQKELKESKELMVLLSKSTVRDLSTDEQKQVQKQLLDVFKTIPSLAIFMLPGGALLLPLFIKFIPKLLPSAFDDNRIEE